MKFSSVAALEVVSLTTSSAANNENFSKMIWHFCLNIIGTSGDLVTGCVPLTQDEGDIKLHLDKMIHCLHPYCIPQILDCLTSHDDCSYCSGIFFAVYIFFAPWFPVAGRYLKINSHITTLSHQTFWLIIIGIQGKSDWKIKSVFVVIIIYTCLCFDNVRNIDQFHKSQNASIPYPTMLHSEQKCAHFCTEWSIVGYGTGAFWDLWIRSIRTSASTVMTNFVPWDI